MTNLLLLPVTQSVHQGRRIANLAARVASPLVGSARSTARSTIWFAPSLVAGSAERIAAHLPDVIARQFPARAAEVDHLEARVARLEAAASATPVAPAPKPMAVPKTRTAAKARPVAKARTGVKVESSVKVAPTTRPATAARKSTGKAKAISAS